MTGKHTFSEAPEDFDPDAPPLTEEQIASARPFAEVFPELAATIRRRGPQKAPTKVSTTLRLSPEVIDHFRSGGRGWQARIDEALRQWVAEHRAH